jgi:hypothetical protein
VRSHEGSARLKWTIQPFTSRFETTEAYVDGKPTAENPIIAYSFGPLITLFSDQVTNAKLDAAGVTPRGNVTGAVGSLNCAISPKLFDYRVVLRASVKQTEAFIRDSRRRAEFSENSTLSSVSLDYDLGLRSFEKGPGWVPSIGVSYTKGDDPLSGKLNQEETVAGFKLTYKAP